MEKAKNIVVFFVKNKIVETFPNPKKAYKKLHSSKISVTLVFH